MRLALAALAAAALVAPALAQDAPPQSQNPIQALDDCVTANAQRLEISGEAADLVATAALVKCNRELTAASGDKNSVFRSGGPTREELKASMRDSAIADIVEIRAARNAPKPAPPLPVRTKKKH